MNRTYAFQYATTNRTYKDTGLITRGEAKKLWNEHIDIFMQHLEEGIDAEMAIWSDMDSEYDYHTMWKYVHTINCYIKDGTLYENAEVEFNL